METNKLQCLFNSWGHSREEDADGLTVYRPAGYKFPLSRGRDGLEFRSDGTVIFSGPGPDDRATRVTGVWKRLDDNALALHKGGAEVSPQRMTIIDCNEDVLKVRWNY
jgi:hypothetical protein